MAASIRIAMRFYQFKDIWCHLSNGTNKSNMLKDCCYRRFGVWNQRQARNYDDDPGSKPQKLQFVRVEEYEKMKPKSVFAGRGVSVNFMLMMQKKLDLSPGSIKRWFWRRRHEQMVKTQSTLSEEWTILGPELAAAHFIVGVGGGILFTGQKKWLRKEKDQEALLPKTPVQGACIEAIDLSRVEILYEGLRHFERLHKVQWLSLHNCRHVDDWFLDKVASIFRHSLVYLDISNCENVTERGLSILHRLKYLKSLKISGLKKVKHGPLVCMLLEEAMPQCTIEGIDYWHYEEKTGVAKANLKQSSPPLPAKYLKSLKISGLKKVKHGPLVCMLLEEAMPQCTIEGIDYWHYEEKTGVAKANLKQSSPPLPAK